VQAALNDIQAAMIANGGGRYVLELGDSILRIDGALQDTANANAQLLLPVIDITQPQCSLVIRGAADPSIAFSVIGTIPKPAKGTRIKSTLASGSGTTPALMAGRAAVGSTYNFTLLQLVLENVEIELPNNPTISAVNAGYVTMLEMRNVAIHVGTYRTDQVTLPTTAGSYGLICPILGNGAYTWLKNVQVLGFYNGIAVSDHVNAPSISAMACRVGLEVRQSLHAILIGRFLAQHCIVAVGNAGADAPIDIEQLAVEHIFSGPFSESYTIDDNGNHLRGKCRYTVCLSGGGNDNANITVRGGRYFSFIAMGATTNRWGQTGNATLVGGTIAVANIYVTADTIVQLSRKTAGGTIGDLTYTATPGTGFSINSASNTDTSTVSYSLTENTTQ